MLDMSKNELSMGDIVIFIFKNEFVRSAPIELLFGIISCGDSNGWYNIDYYDQETKEIQRYYTPDEEATLKIHISQVPEPLRRILARKSMEYV
jgi:hypothetical protein